MSAEATTTDCEAILLMSDDYIGILTSDQENNILSCYGSWLLAIPPRYFTDQPWVSAAVNPHKLSGIPMWVRQSLLPESRPL